MIEAQRHHAKVINQAIQCPATLFAYGQFKQEDQRVQSNNEVRNKWNAEPGRIVANGNHEGLDCVI